MKTRLTILSAVICFLPLVARAQVGLPSIPPLHTPDGTYEASRVFKSTFADLVSFHVYNSKGSAQYVLIMDAAALPANGTVTLLYPPIKVSADSTVSLVLPRPLHAVNGITVCNSSTAQTKTIGSADCYFEVQTQPQ